MLYKKVNGWKDISSEKAEKIFLMGKNTKKYWISEETEREFIDFSVELAKECGFIEQNIKIKSMPGDKVYYVNREKKYCSCCNW